MMKKMSPTVGNCFALSQTIKGKNETLNCALDDVRVGAQLCWLMTQPNPLMLPELSHRVT